MGTGESSCKIYQFNDVSSSARHFQQGVNIWISNTSARSNRIHLAKSYCQSRRLQIHRAGTRASARNDFDLELWYDKSFGSSRILVCQHQKRSTSMKSIPISELAFSQASKQSTGYLLNRFEPHRQDQIEKTVFLLQNLPSLVKHGHSTEGINRRNYPLKSKEHLPPRD